MYVVDETGGPIQPLAHKAGFFDVTPSWSRDGKWIYFGSNRTGRAAVWRAPPDGGDAQQVTTFGSTDPRESSVALSPLESSDGRTLYFSRATEGERILFAMPLTGGPERRLDVTTVFWNYFPAERGLYYVPPRQGQKPPYTYEVRFLDFATGKSRVIHRVRLADMGPGLSVSGDGKTVLVSGVAVITSDLMWIENFR